MEVGQSTAGGLMGCDLLLFLVELAFPVEQCARKWNKGHDVFTASKPRDYEGAVLFSFD